MEGLRTNPELAVAGSGRGVDEDRPYVVVHRFSTLERADHTIVFDRADVVGEGVSPPPLERTLFSWLQQL
jgi:ABC-type transport system involved in Fe-S cluster assembly fused permease/ATPase subunit